MLVFGEGGAGRVLFQIPAAKSIWATFVQPTCWTAEPFRAVYRQGTPLLALLLPLLAGTWGELPQDRWEEDAANNLLHWFSPWSGARLSSAHLGCLPSCPPAFPSRKYCVWTTSDRDLPKLFSKTVSQEELVISPRDLFQCWATCAVRKLFLPRLLNFQCKPVTLNSFTSWPRE